MKCFYHKSDLDGHCSGALIKLIYPECEMIGVDYNSSFHEYAIKENETIYIVDFSFSPDAMHTLNNIADLIWIDHHKSAMEKVDPNIPGLREIGKAGCELTWEYLYGRREIPRWVSYLGRYDVWDHSDKLTLPFQYGMREQEDTLPGAQIWEDLSLEGWEQVVTHIISKGHTILAYEEKQNAMYAKAMYYEVTFENLRAIVINKSYSNSKIFDSVYNPKKHDVMILFGIKMDEYKYSIYCNKPGIDVSIIATKYGGGGHAGAAGFYSRTRVL